MSVKLKDIAIAAGVSKATVSMALNKNALINSETRKRIEAIAAEMGYVPNSYARKLVLQKSGILGLVVPDVENVYYASFIRHVNEYVRRTGYGLSIAISQNMPETEEKAVYEMRSNRVEGIIFVPVNVPSSHAGYFRTLDGAGIPYVFATTRYPDVKADCVMCDLAGGMYELVRLAVSRGYARPFLITGPEGVYTLELRKAGYIRALSGVLPDKAVRESILQMDEVTYEAAAEAAARLIGEGRGADVIFCVNDMMALGVINTLTEHGVRVPEDVAVTGFDDGIFASTSPVPLTTVRQDICGIASRAIDLLHRRIEEGGGSQTQDVILPTRIIERKSLGGKGAGGHA